MDKKTYKNWKSLTDKILEDCWKFRKYLCDKPFDRGFIGELLVIKQLLKTYKTDICSLPENSITYAGSSNKGWDIELKLNARSIFFNAKSTTQDESGRPKWVRQSASTFCVVEFAKIKPKGFKQDISLRTDYDSNLYYVFVDVGTWLKNRNADYFILSDKEAKSTFGKIYLKLKNGKVRKSKSTDFWVEYRDIKNFKDKYLKSIRPHFLK